MRSPASRLVVPAGRSRGVASTANRFAARRCETSLRQHGDLGGRVVARERDDVRLDERSRPREEEPRELPRRLRHVRAADDQHALPRRGRRDEPRCRRRGEHPANVGAQRTITEAPSAVAARYPSATISRSSTVSASGASTAGAPEAERASSASVTAAGPRVRSASRCSSRPARARKCPSDRSSAHSSSRALEYANTPSRAYSVSCSAVRRPSRSKRWIPPTVTRPAEGSAGTSRSTGRPAGATTSRTPRYSSSR